MKRFFSVAVRDALLGLASGALTALVLRLTAEFLLLGNNVSKSHALEVVLDTPHLVLVAIVVVLSLVVFWARQILGFLIRFVRSWSAGLVTGVLQVWFVCSLVFFLRLDQLTSKGFLSLALVGLLPVLLGFIWKQRPARKVDYSINVPVPTGLADPSLLSRQIDFDLPIHEWGEDRLGRGQLIRSVASRVLKDRAPVIAIVGPFGEGKTSTLNLLAKSLDSRKDLSIVVKFSSWLPGGEETLVLSLFGTISEQVKSRYLVPGLSGELRRFARLLVGTFPRVGEVFRNLFEEPSQVEQLRRLTRVLGELPIQIVVLVVELDRMDSKELHTLLKALRGVVDLPNISYVCAFDRETVTRLIDNDDPGYAERYLDKFFPIQFSIPRIDQGLLGTLFDQKLEEIVVAFNLLPTERERKALNDSLLEVWHTVLKRYLSNFRRMNLYFNALRSALEPVAAEVNLYDMMVLQVVKMMSEKTYEFIYENGPVFYDPSLRVTLWMERLSVDEKAEAAIRNTRLKEFFDSLPTELRSQVTDLLGKIFPIVNRFVRGDHFWRGAQNADRAEKEHRVYHPDYFPRYFIHQVPSGMFGIAEMMSFAADMNSLDDVEQCTALFRKVVNGLASNPWKRWDFFRSLVSEAEKFGSTQSEAAVYGVVEVSDSLEEDFLGLSDWGRARAVLFVAAKHFSGAPKLEKVLADAIGNATSDAFAVDILAFCTSARAQNKIITDWQRVDEAVLKTAFGKRMRTRFANASRESFQYDRKDLRPFHVWASTSEETRGGVVDFFRDRFDRDATDAGRFLSWTLPRRGVYESDPLIAVQRLFPVDQLFELVRNKPTDFWGDTDRESVEWFLELAGKTHNEGNDASGVEAVPI